MTGLHLVKHFNGRRLLSLLILCLTICVSVGTGKSADSFTQLPPELSAVVWTRTPQDILRSPQVGESLVWVGQVEEVLISQNGSKVELLWVCKHLRFANPGPAAISQRPIKVETGDGTFAVSVVAENMSVEQARKFKREHTASPHYLLAGGTFQSFVEHRGIKIPFLHTLRMGLGPQLATFK